MSLSWPETRSCTDISRQRNVNTHALAHSSVLLKPRCVAPSGAPALQSCMPLGCPRFCF